ncbi:MAG TPA: hypothetical protein VGF96_02880 [Terracidiphilus sp.]
MRRIWWIPLCLLVVIPPVVVFAGGDRGFDGVVRSIETRYHAHATRIPFLGIASLVARNATHNGVSGMHIAEFDNFSAEVDGDELNRLIEEKLGAGWERMIRETSKKGHEQTLIFTRPDGDRMDLFVVDLDGRELDVVQVAVDPSHLNESIAHYGHHGGDVSD